jgi:hypothetical protein
MVFPLEAVEATDAAKVQDGRATSFVTGWLKNFRRGVWEQSWLREWVPAKMHDFVLFPSNLSASVRRNKGSGFLPSQLRTIRLEKFRAKAR